MIGRAIGGLLILAGLYCLAAGGLAHNLPAAGVGAGGVLVGMWIRRRS